MNESISIKEGNIGRRIAPVDKIKVNTTSDDESMWVPSERGNTGVLYASENGIYIASEAGYESSSEVVVRVTEESFYGDNDFDHWNYEVPTDFPDLWDSLTLDDFNVDPLAFDDLFNNKDIWDMDIPDLPDKLDFKMKDLKTKKPKKEKITGIDPVSGNEMAVGLDNFGHLTEQILPTSIAVIRQPSKLKYIEGETILFDGIAVQAYKADGSVWEDENHANGIIPRSELQFPEQIARWNGGIIDYNGEKISYSSTFGIYIQFGRTNEEWEKNIYGHASCYGEKPIYGFMLSTTGRDGYGIAMSLAPFSGSYSIYDGATRQISVSAIEVDGVIVYYGAITYNFNPPPVEGYRYVFSPQPVKMTVEQAARAIIHGEDKESEMAVPVEWSRIGDGQVLSSSFTITVTKKEGGSSGTSDTQAITYNGTRYVANEDMNAEAHYQSGTVWIRGEAKVWSVQDAVAFGLLKPEEEKDGGSDSGSEHEGGHF
jgi:hypothetical protein